DLDALTRHAEPPEARFKKVRHPPFEEFRTVQIPPHRVDARDRYQFAEQFQTAAHRIVDRRWWVVDRYYLDDQRYTIHDARSTIREIIRHETDRPRLARHLGTFEGHAGRFADRGARAARPSPAGFHRQPALRGDRPAGGGTAGRPRLVRTDD